MLVFPSVIYKSKAVQPRPFAEFNTLVLESHGRGNTVKKSVKQEDLEPSPIKQQDLR